MNVSAREWSVQYEQLKKSIANKRINSHGFTADEIKSINNTINTLDSQLRVMSQSPLQYEIATSEIARRQVLMDNLKKQSFRPSTTNTFSIDSSSSSSASRGTYNPMGTTDQGLVQRQQDVIKEQDETLAQIESGVGRLHEKAKAIGEETKQSVRLLDDLDSNVEIATAALQAEAKHAEQIRDKAKVCWMYVCIAVEVLVLLLMIIIIFAT